jgi:hypothetical protein
MKIIQIENKYKIKIRFKMYSFHYENINYNLFFKLVVNN